MSDADGQLPPSGEGENGGWGGSRVRLAVLCTGGTLTVFAVPQPSAELLGLSPNNALAPLFIGFVCHFP